MALIKGKQIESIAAAQVIETASKKFVAQSDIDRWNSANGGSGTCYVAKTIKVPVTDGQTKINTGIMFDGSGNNHTDNEEFIVMVNGMIQDNTVDYTYATDTDELVITWLDADFALEATDVFTITFNQLS